MEYERALFRVHERTIEALRYDGPCLPGRAFAHVSRPSTCCAVIQAAVLLLALTLLSVISYLHVNYVNQPGACLEDAVMLAAQQYPSVIICSTNCSAPPPESGNSTSVQSDIITLPSGVQMESDIVLRIGLLAEDLAEEFSPLYTFSFQPIVMLLSEEMREKHDFVSLNVTLDPQCFGPPVGAVLLSHFVGYDTAMINQLMFTFQSRGLLVSEANQKEWFWSKSEVFSGRLAPAGEVAARKILSLGAALVSFFLMTSVTAMLVRVLLSSGVSFMFALLLIPECLNIMEIDMRVLRFSYPWLGVPVAALRRNGKAIMPFLMGHGLLVVVCYTMYTACMSAWSYTLYDGKSMEALFEVSIYAVVLVWEYFSLVFVRSKCGILFFPRATFFYWIGWATYFYYFSYGYFGLLGLVFGLLLLHAMLFTLSKLEAPSLARGEVSYEYPRARYVALPYPALQYAVPETWTIFVAPNTEVRSIYQGDIPSRPATNEERPAVAPVQEDEEADSVGDPADDPRQPLRRRMSGTAATEQEFESA
jgi:hypothetical protein